MTSYDVDLAELRRAIGELAACQRDLVVLAGEIDRAHARLHEDWSGRAAIGEASSYDS
ncbi:hypothetical protein [Nocardioides sp. SYSU D00065]|uniref:hypothetical protein n=1 Tax=Nocardioides sp. SYSU D00065 TaxID=2817378 RepID=UPI001B3238E7|nr:hypothetical protein [Nocardioides sp. SYSU D00065]